MAGRRGLQAAGRPATGLPVGEPVAGVGRREHPPHVPVRLPPASARPDPDPRGRPAPSSRHSPLSGECDSDAGVQPSSKSKAIRNRNGRLGPAHAPPRHSEPPSRHLLAGIEARPARIRAGSGGRRQRAQPQAGTAAAARPRAGQFAPLMKYGRYFFREPVRPLVHRGRCFTEPAGRPSAAFSRVRYGYRCGTGPCRPKRSRDCRGPSAGPRPEPGPCRPRGAARGGADSSRRRNRASESPVCGGAC